MPNVFHPGPVCAYIAVLGLGCSPDKGGSDSNSDSGDDSSSYYYAEPRETEWNVVVDQLPFPLDGAGKVDSITIGRREYNQNFANRGNVEVLLDHDEAVITIEMKIYEFTDGVVFDGDPAALPPFVGTRDRMLLWAFVGAGAPTVPSLQNPADDCTRDTWKSGCRVGIYFDGKTQPLRSGADLRVHLPRAYRGRLDVETEDNLAEPTYPRLGNITLDGLCGDADVTLSAGVARVRMCSELEVAPTCSAAQIEQCETFTDDLGENAAWSPACPCGPDRYGQVRVSSRKPYAANITVDMPSMTWMNVTASNDSPDQPHGCSPTLDNCSDPICTPMANSAYSISGEFNYPSPSAESRTGFNLTALSAGCGPVMYYASPSDWSPVSEPVVSEHGHVRVCTDCL